MQGADRTLAYRPIIRRVTASESPLLVAQRANDPRVKKSESDQIVRVMRQKGLDVEDLVYPDEGHGFARPVNRVSFYAAAERFLAKYLGGSAEPLSEAEVKHLAAVTVTGP